MDDIIWGLEEFEQDEYGFYFEPEPQDRQKFYAQDGSPVYWNKSTRTYKFESDHPYLLDLKAGDDVPAEWGIV